MFYDLQRRRGCYAKPTHCFTGAASSTTNIAQQLQRISHGEVPLYAVPGALTGATSTVDM